MTLSKHIYLLILFGATGCKDATREVFVNFQKYESTILQADAYFKKMAPKNLVFYIKFGSGDKIDFKLDQKNYFDKSSWNTNSIFDKYGQFHKFDADLNDAGIIEALNILNINRQKVDKLKNYLLEANCNSIGNNFSFSDNIKVSSTFIGYPTCDLYGLNYVVFERNLDSLQVVKIIEPCNYKKIDNRVFVSYGGPPFGSNCFPDKR